MNLDVLDPPDVPVMTRLADGDEAAFKKIYEANRKNTVVAAFIILQCHETAEEVAQEVFVKIWQMKDKLGHVKNLQAFLFIMARNHALTILKKWNTQQKAAAWVSLQRRYETVRSPEELFIELEHEHQVERILNTMLTQRELTIYRLSREKKMSHQEIAEHLKISKHTVNNHIKAALTALKLGMKK